MLTHVDINCDMGEVTTDNHDERFMPFISSCNVSCGAHAGDPDVIARTVEAAIGAGVAIGAHPSYPDRDHFGRRSIIIDGDALADTISEQIAFLRNIVSAFGGTVAYVKPHGALYNDMAIDAARATTVLDAIVAAGDVPAVYGMANSGLAQAAASRGLRFVHEVFADRRYEPDLTLVPRTRHNAVIESESELVAQLDGFTQNQTVITSDGQVQTLTIESICVHSDTPGALKLAHRIHEYLLEHDVRIHSPL